MQRSEQMRHSGAPTLWHGVEFQIICITYPSIKLLYYRGALIKLMPRDLQILNVSRPPLTQPAAAFSSLSLICALAELLLRFLLARL
jgi:hypothetical protein